MNLKNIEEKLQKKHIEVASFEEVLQYLNIKVTEISNSPEFKKLIDLKMTETYTEGFQIKELHHFEGDYLAQIDELTDYLVKRKESLVEHLKEKGIETIKSIRIGKPKIRNGIMDFTYERIIPEEDLFISLLEKQFIGPNDMLFQIIDDVMSFNLFGIQFNYRLHSQINPKGLKSTLENEEDLQDVLRTLIKHKVLMTRV